jgi:site-specific DNA-methyltransferase (adenine-specific)
MNSVMAGTQTDIRPWAIGANFSLFHGDCISILDSMPSDSVDLIFADPPYNLSNDGYTVHAGKRTSVNKGKWDRSSGVEEDFQFHMSWITSCRRVLKSNGTMWISGTYHSIYACGHALQKQGWRILNDISWFKPNASPNLGCRMFTASHETLLWASKDKTAKHVFNYEQMKNGAFSSDFLKRQDRQMRSVWAIGTPSANEKRFGKHPTQKPIELMLRVILASSHPSDLVLDPFCGSATTGVAALRLSRAFVGIDNNISYLKKLAAPRLQAEEAQTSLRLI